MHIVLFTHPTFLGSQSMPRFAAMLSDGMKQRGHSVEIWTPTAFFYKLPVTIALKKWLGYIDQYLLFPIKVKARLKRCPKDTLFVFTDHALGPWVPLVADRPHVIHCHDFLAQQSALGKLENNRVSFTGKIYQRYIFNGYSIGKNFISVSKKTRNDLHQLLGFNPSISMVVYNGLNQKFSTSDADQYQFDAVQNDINVSKGFILHVGGNQWYKNRVGLIEIYNAWRRNFTGAMPLVMIGVPPNKIILNEYNSSPFKADIHILTGKTDRYVRSAYAQATLFLFPSLAEGFGWPIAEAMASGCPVITTNEAPMTEVGGDAALLIKKRPVKPKDIAQWADDCACVVNDVLVLSVKDRQAVINNGIQNSMRFDKDTMLENVNRIYTGLVNVA